MDNQEYIYQVLDGIHNNNPIIQDILANMVYEYEKTPEGYTNVTLFGDVSLDFESLLQKKEYTEESIQSAKNQIEIAKKWLLNRSEGMSGLYDFYLQRLNEMHNQLEYAQITMPIEIQKTGFLTHVDYQDIYEKIEDIQKCLYGESVNSNKEELQKVLAWLWYLLVQNTKNISKEDAKFFEVYLKSFGYNLKELSRLYQWEQAQENAIWLQKIPLDICVKAFEKVLEFYNLDWRVEVSNTASSIHVDSVRSLFVIPQGYRYLGLSKWLMLMAHEIETHVFSYINTYKTTWIRGEKTVFTQEGFALYKQKKAIGQKQSSFCVTPGISHITTFFGERCGGNKLWRLLRIYIQLLDRTDFQTASEMSFMRVLRCKKGFPFSQKGAHRKDVAYTRWYTQVLQYLENGGSETLLHAGRFYVDDADFICDFVRKNHVNIEIPTNIAKILADMFMGNRSIDDEFLGWSEKSKADLFSVYHTLQAGLSREL